MAYAREIFIAIKQKIRFQQADKEADSHYTVLGNTLVRISNHCTWMKIWDNYLQKNPQDAKVLKANPDLLFMANALSQGLNYQDDYFLMSDRVVANKKNLYQMAFYNEIFMVYVYTASTNGITTTKQLVLATARDEITIGIYGKKEEQDAGKRHVTEYRKH